jgi:putative YhgA-like transposase
LKPGDRLPVVLPLVIHSGRGRWRAPLRLESHFVPVPRDLKRYLPRLTYLLVDERRLDLNRPELERNPTAAFFEVEVNESAEALLGLYQQLTGRIPPEDSDLRRIIAEWFTGVVQRIVPKAIIPKGVNLEEPSMLEENLIRMFKEVKQEGRREGQILSLQTMILQQMTLRFGRLPAKVRRQVEEISSLQELRKLGRRVLRAKNLEEMGLGHG